MIWDPVRDRPAVLQMVLTVLSGWQDRREKARRIAGIAARSVQAWLDLDVPGGRNQRTSADGVLAKVFLRGQAGCDPRGGLNQGRYDKPLIANIRFTSAATVTSEHSL
jgi:hypothetical protein